MRTTWLISAALFLFVGGGAATPEKAIPEKASNIFESPVRPVPVSPIDKAVFAKLSSLGVQPALCSDAVFVRRVYFDVIGTLPTAEEARDFIQDPDAKNKRRLLIDRLLERSEFADYWAMKWGDVLRIKAEFPINLWPNAAQAYHRWVRASITENKPYDKFVREMLTASGSNFRVGPVNFYRAMQNRTPEATAAAVALTFMGTRTDSWPKDRLAGMAVFFAQIGYKPTREWKEEHVFWDPYNTTEPGKVDLEKVVKPTKKPAVAEVPVAVAPVAKSPLAATFPDGTKIQLSRSRDPREIFADWLITPKNPWFSKSIVNRVWAWLLGRGIVHEPDDFRDGNPPSNPELLACLEKEFVASHYDLKNLYRLILNSQTYQISSIPGPKASGLAGGAAEANFASYPLRRMDAEVLIDAINKVTGTTDLYTSPIPEPFTYIPDDMPAIAIADGSITSPFLALFGRSARATGLENERNNKPVPAQAMHMLNSSHIQQKLDQGPKLKAIFDSGRKPAEIIDELYLTILSRPPTPVELESALDYGKLVPVYKRPAPKPPVGKKSGAAKKSGLVAAPAVAAKPVKVYPIKRHDDWVDIAWVLINSEEFLYRH